MNVKTYGQIAYQAYTAHCGGKSIHGEQLPEWEQQEPEIQAHWEHAATAVINAACPE